MNTSVIDFSYEPFSKEPEYIEVNRRFIEGLRLGATKRVLDLACGPGTLTELILEQTKSANGTAKPAFDFIALDLSRDSLDFARKRLADQAVVERTGQGRSSAASEANNMVGFVQASADLLPFADCSMHAVIMGNAIQLLDDKGKLVREVSRVLSPSGVFAFNTSFYAGTFPPGTENFYVRWLQAALEYIQRKDQELKKQGVAGITRRRGLSKPAFTQGWLSENEYTQLLEQEGFEVKNVVKRTVLLTQHSLEAIGSYSGLASVLLSGYPVKLACDALVESAGPALVEAGLEAVPRQWIEFVASKR